MFRALFVPERNRESLQVGLGPSGVIFEMTTRHIGGGGSEHLRQYDLITGHPKALVTDLRSVYRRTESPGMVIGHLYLPESRTFTLELYQKQGEDWVKPPVWVDHGPEPWARFTWYMKSGESSPWGIYLRKTEAEKLASLIEDYWTI